MRLRFVGGRWWSCALCFLPQRPRTNFLPYPPPTTIDMQPNRLGIGHRPPMQSYGQGPSISALAAQQHMQHPPAFVPPQPKPTTLFIGSISGGITDAFLNELLKVRSPCRVLRSSGIDAVVGVRSYHVFQAIDNPREQASGLRFCRVSGP